MTDITNTEFYWDNVVFKVEDTLFRVPRCEFEQSSKVFADMFRLPSGVEKRLPGVAKCLPGISEQLPSRVERLPGVVERPPGIPQRPPSGVAASAKGQDKELPIVLEGYTKDEFSCLLKVMYPRAKSLISGTKFELGLKKEEWIRECAIDWLSTNGALTPIEKIQLARAHKVATWLEEGLTSLVDGAHKLTRAELATLGWETSALILWISNNLIPSPKDGSTTIALSLDMIKCAICPSAPTLIRGKLNECIHCHNSTGKFTYKPVASAPASGPYCNSCSPRTKIPTGGDVRIMAKNGPMIMIGEAFGEEIKEYKLTMSVA
ncbi:hypothetical protein BYT27DRAFT_7210524 [Phlegmacium glaucopus]|nr:hypothetical protein BYT27DRAFT_7210524 [Phlegmacium glaucopus]